MGVLNQSTKYKIFFKWNGRGVPDLGMVEIEFYFVIDRGGPQLPDALDRIKKYVS